MDPLSALGAAGSVVGVASFGIQLSQVLYQFTSQALSANESLLAIQSGIQATTGALNHVHGFLADECDNLERNGRAVLFSPKAIDEVKSTADKCLLIFWRIEATITNKSGSKFEQELIERLNAFNKQLTTKKPLEPIPVDKTLISLTTWGRLRWPYIASKLDNYTSQLQILQMSLVLMFSVISLHAHRIRPAQGEQDLRIFIKAYDEIRRMAARPEFSQIAPNLTDRVQNPQRPSASKARRQLRIESPAPMRNNLRADDLPWGSKRQSVRPLSLPPMRDQQKNSKSNFLLEREFGTMPRGASTHADSDSMDFMMSASRSISSVIDLDPVILEEMNITGRHDEIAQEAKTYISPTIITTHSTDSEEAAKKESEPKISPKNDKNNEFDAKSSLNVELTNRTTRPIRRELAPDSPDNLITIHYCKDNDENDRLNGSGIPDEDHKPGTPILNGVLTSPSIKIDDSTLISADPKVEDVQQTLRTQKATLEDLEAKSPQLSTSPVGAVTIPAEDKARATPISLPQSTLQAGSNNSKTLGLDSEEICESTSALLLSSKPDADNSNHEQVVDKYDSRSQSLESYHSPSSNVESRDIFSRLKSIFVGTQPVKDVFLTAYIIKDGEAYEVPHPGVWKLKRKEIKNLHYQSSKKDWHKIFAFLNEYDMAALQDLLGKSASDCVESTNSIVYLKKLESRLKFWARKEAVFAIIRDSSLEASSTAYDSQIDIEDFSFESATELNRTQLPASSLHPPGNSQPLPEIRLPQKPIATNPIIPTMPQITPEFTSSMSSRPPPPPPPPPRHSAIGPAALLAQNYPPRPPTDLSNKPTFDQHSARVQDLTPPRNLKPSECLGKLTTYAVFVIREVPPLDPDAESSWARAEVTQERLPQDIINKQIKKLGDSDVQTVAEKKAELDRYQQIQITHLLDNLASKEPDQNFEWLLIQLECMKKPVKRIHGSRKRFQLGITTISVYVSRTPLQSLDPVLLFQRLEEARARRWQPLPGGASKVPPPKMVTVNNPEVISISAGDKGKSSKPKRRRRGRYSHSSDGSDSSTVGGTSISSIAPRSTFQSKRERKGEGPLTVPPRPRDLVSKDSNQPPSRPSVTGRKSRPFVPADEVGWYSRDRPRTTANFVPSYPPTSINAAQEHIDRNEREWHLGHHNLTSQPPPTGPNLERVHVSYPSHYDSKPYNPQFDDAAAQVIDEEGQDMVQRLLLEWTPLDQEEEQVQNHTSEKEPALTSVKEAASSNGWGALVMSKMTKNEEDRAVTDGSKDEHKQEASSPTLKSLEDAEESLIQRGRSLHRGNASATKEPSRQATVHDAIDERDHEAIELSTSVPSTAAQKGKGREEELEGFTVETISNGSQAEGSPIPLPQPQSQSQHQPSWLDPFYAKNLVDKTVPQPGIAKVRLQTVEPSSNQLHPSIVKAESPAPQRSKPEQKFMHHKPIRHQSIYESSGTTPYPQSYGGPSERLESGFLTRDGFLQAGDSDPEVMPWRAGVSSRYDQPTQRPEMQTGFAGSEYTAAFRASEPGYYTDLPGDGLGQKPFSPSRRSEPMSSFTRDGYSEVLPERRYSERDYTINSQTGARINDEQRPAATRPMRSGTSGSEPLYTSPRVPLLRRY